MRTKCPKKGYARNVLRKGSHEASGHLSFTGALKLNQIHYKSGCGPRGMQGILTAKMDYCGDFDKQISCVRIPWV